MNTNEAVEAVETAIIAFMSQDVEALGKNSQWASVTPNGARLLTQAALAAAHPIIMEEAWQPIETAPADERILAAVQVINNKTGASWWERHTIVIDSETGEIHPDNDAGWGIADYTHWMPLPPPPQARTNEVM